MIYSDLTVANLTTLAWKRLPHLMGWNVMMISGTDTHAAVIEDFKRFRELVREDWRKALLTDMIEALECSL